MDMDTQSIIAAVLDNLSNLAHIEPSELPKIDLYMDQVTTFMEAQLSSSKRYPEDKVLTKTMINNYAKNHLIPSPEKKRYTKEHLLLLIFIYYFKNLLSINDIQTLLGPITDKYFNSETEKDLTYIYNEVFQAEKAHIEDLKDSLKKSFESSEKTFQDVSDEDRDFLKTFTFICLLSYDVYAKKKLIESLIDTMPPVDPKKKPKK